MHQRACTACVFLFHSRHSCTPFCSARSWRHEAGLKVGDPPRRQQEAATFFHSGCLLPLSSFPCNTPACTESISHLLYLNTCQLFFVYQFITRLSKQSKIQDNNYAFTFAHFICYLDSNFSAIYVIVQLSLSLTLFLRKNYIYKYLIFNLKKFMHA